MVLDRFENFKIVLEPCDKNRAEVDAGRPIAHNDQEADTQGYVSEKLSLVFGSGRKEDGIVGFVGKWVRRGEGRTHYVSGGVDPPIPCTDQEAKMLGPS